MFPKLVELIVLLLPVVVLTLLLMLPSKRDAYYQAETISNLLNEGKDVNESQATKTYINSTSSHSEDSLTSQTEELSSILQANSYDNIQEKIRTNRTGQNPLDRL